MILRKIRTASRLLPHTARDLLFAGVGSFDPPLLFAELAIDHRVRSRVFVAEMMPKHGVGAEIGVFSGLFSSVLLKLAKPREMYFADCWWKGFGDRFGDWGPYTAHGRLTTRAAYTAAMNRIARQGGDTQCHVVVDDSAAFLESLPERHLDWVYLDSGPHYEQSALELQLLATRLKPGGLLVGDDWNDDPAVPHFGLTRAITEAIAAGRFDLVGRYEHKQWAVRVPT